MWIRNYTDEIAKYLKDSNASAEAFEKFEEYKKALTLREDLISEYPGNNIFQASKWAKDKLNEYSSKIINYEVEIMGSPIYEDLKKKYENQSDWPDFMRDNKGKFRETPLPANTGWYQNSKGELFHYDGTIWDNVPEERLQALEYLG